MIPTIWRSEKGKTMETVKRSVVAKGKGEGGLNSKNTEGFQGSETILYDAINGGYTSFCICQNP